MAAHFLITVFRTVLMYFAILLTLRIMGKREIGKLSIFDLVISVMIAEIGVFVLEDVKRPILDGILPMATLVIIQVSIAYISLKSRKVRLLFDGQPSILVSKGKLQRSEMKKQRYNLDDLLLHLRGQNIHNIADVEFAILENSGHLTVIPKSQSSQQSSGQQPSGGLSVRGNMKFSGNQGARQQGQQSSGSSISTHSKSNKKILVPAGKFSYGVLPVPLIMDGKVQDDNLQKLKKNRFWLKNQIQEHGVKEFKDVFLCSIDHKGKVYVDRK
ncbi:DUF421 domain-containing protein [Paenibacillus sp. KQZ6P-2]|uniref:DUF421 domain-containing protein n=1 Tax=Paenibacillus mangrovi TaxID=2931978 RepID=A0A9X1WMN4_9BACL|nr:DUF421 domain-containing protein [Paenibacillus mangrovi]MCJ8011709.1 DUF421 domain-containing protein [Paenibacillus mangrovi]